MIKSLTFITSNSSKAEQLAMHLKFPVAHQKLDLDEIQSLNLAEIIEHKAKEAFRQVQTPVLVEDTSLRFLALGKLPGPLIKWFLTELDNDGLCKLLSGYSSREALAEVNFGFFDGVRLKIFDGQINGSIANTPRGNRGFGWDPIFIPQGWDKTWGEMDIEEQKQTSMRRIALKKLDYFLNNL